MEVIYTVKDAKKKIESGCIVAVMTDTVMGLIADGNNHETIRLLYQLKQRPIDKSCIVFIDKLDKLATIATNFPSYVYKLSEKFWPGALTLVLPAHKNNDYCFLANKNTIGIRMPQSPDILELLASTKALVVSTSANISGRQELKSKLEIEKTFGDHIVYWQVDIQQNNQQASTIIDACASDCWSLKREGSITKEMIWEVLDK